MSSLTEEQRRRIEENRRLAIQKRLEKQQQSKASNPPAHNFFKNPNNASAKPPIPSTTPAHNFFKNSTYALTKPPQIKVNSFKPTSNPSKPKEVKTWSNISITSGETVSGVCTLMSRDRFCVDIPYYQKVIDVFKTIDGRQYDQKSRKWNFSLSKYNEFKEAVSSLAPQFVFGNLPKNVLQMFASSREEAQESREDSLGKVEKTLADSLFPFQREGVRFGVSRNGRCLIADEMGLGKTVQALGIADYYRSDWPLLIVCPSSMRYQWQEEIGRFLPSVPSYSVFVMSSRRDIVEDPRVLIISFDLMGKLKDFLKTLRFGVVIVDESHNLKSTKTQRTKAAMEILSRTKRCILLSGTPALSRPSELFPQIKILAPTLFKDMIEFGVRYCEGKQDRFGWNFSGSCNLEELRVILDEKIMIRRLKADVLDQLPTKLRQVIVLNSEDVDLDQKTMSHFAKKLSQDLLKGSEKRSTLLSYFAETGKAKIRAVCSYITKLLEENRKFLIFAHHRPVLNAVCDLLESKKTYYIRIDGSVSSDERKSVCDQFQEEEKFRVAVLSLKAANTGVTLTAAQLVVFAELFWNPGELIQAEDRAHRIGQKSSVLVQYLIAKGTADDFLWPLVQSKLNVLNQAGLSKDSQLSLASTTAVSPQPKITSFFSQMYDDDIDETDLACVLDEIEGGPEKKMKTN